MYATVLSLVPWRCRLFATSSVQYIERLQQENPTAVMVMPSTKASNIPHQSLIGGAAPLTREAASHNRNALCHQKCRNIALHKSTLYVPPAHAVQVQYYKFALSGSALAALDRCSRYSIMYIAFPHQIKTTYYSSTSYLLASTRASI
jgi:hypothetical protein